jgi:signal transduction histidine kinase
LKNKRFYKHWLSSLAEVTAAALLTYAILVIGNKIFVYLYLNTKIQFINYIFKFWRIIKFNMFGNVINIIIEVLLFVGLYLLITYRKAKSLAAIIDQTEIMANGDLDRLIEVNGENDIKNLAENINNISRQLKEITIVERKAQQTKNDLITNVSHDLRTPLTSIIGYLEIIDADKYKDEMRLRYYVNIAFMGRFFACIKKLGKTTLNYCFSYLSIFFCFMTDDTF